jgi:hypothetical protein
MKVQFSKEVRYVPLWKDNRDLTGNDQVAVALKPLKMGELLDVLDILKRADFKQGTEQQLTPDQMRIIACEAGKYLPEHVTKFEGADGFTLDDVVNYADFFGLSVELIFELVRLSSPSGQDAKN